MHIEGTAERMTGIYHHPPGKLSKWGVVDVGPECVIAANFAIIAI
jgi:hypothetical protein